LTRHRAGADISRVPRSWLAPEVLQTAELDCGPAALKSVLDGLGVPTRYDRLLQASPVGVEGASVDALEQTARDLGLHAEQLLIPPDHLLSRAAPLLPAIVVLQMPDGNKHFVVAWRLGGRKLQVMDPATGGGWVEARPFLTRLYLHEAPVEAARWEGWAASGGFVVALRERLRRLGIRPTALDGVDDWEGLARIEAATSAVTDLVERGQLRPGRSAGSGLARLLARVEPPGPLCVRSAGDGTLLARGAVLVRVAPHPRGSSTISSAIPG
jgi:hypothetical protein